MTAHIRSTRLLVGAAVAALIAPLMAVMFTAAPASSAGPRPHEVYMYKVEKHVDLSGEYPDNYLHDHLYCNDGDIALDGMWRVSHVDQENPQLDVYGDARDVVVQASYSDQSNPSKWHYEIENYADGNAQLKLYLTCIRKQTEERAGHKHSVKLGSYHVVEKTHVPAGWHYWNDVANRCDDGYYAVAPGFHFRGDLDETWFHEDNRIVGSWPLDSGKGWQWRFHVGKNEAQVDLSFRCLATEVVPYGAGKKHTHKLPMMWRPNSDSGGHYEHVDHGWNEYRYSCDDGHDGAFFQDYKAMVGAFWIHGYHYNWFLGMEPRPKTRAYWFWHESGDDRVSLGTLCIKSRTGKQIKPTLS